MQLKNFTLSVLFLFSFGFAHAQCEIANDSFEDWMTTDFILPDENGNDVTGEVFLPEGTTSLFRLLLIGFEVLSDPSLTLLLENEAQELIGISQSTDASEGNFAVQLQAGYGIDLADIYTVSGCSEVPEQFNLDIKHFGETNDSITIIVVFDEGLRPLPQTEEDLANIPAYASTKIGFSSNTEYETISVPVIQNFDAPIDTFYYLIIAETSDDSYFLIDNANFDDENSGCQVFAPTLTMSNEDSPVCICNNLDVSFSLVYTMEPDFQYNELIVDEFGTIVSVDDFIPGSHNEFCYSTENFRAIVIAYKGLVNELFFGGQLDALEGCFELSNELEIETYRIPNFEFNVFVDDEQQDENINICVMDDYEETLSFSADIESDNIAIFLVDDHNETIMFRIDDVDETTTLMGLPVGDYVLAAIRYDDVFNLAVGQSAEDITYEGCFSVAQNVFEVNLLGPDDEQCIVDDVTDIYSGNLSVVPNYSNGVFEITNPNHESYQFVVSDPSGKMVISSKDVSNNQLIDLSRFPNGLYFVSFNIDGYVHQEKIIKL